MHCVAVKYQDLSEKQAASGLLSSLGIKTPISQILIFKENIFVKTNYAKLAFNMIWLNEILRIWLEKQLLIKYYVIKHVNYKNPKYGSDRSENMFKQELAE